MLTKGGAKKEVLKRATTEAKPLELRADFPLQNAFVNDPSRFIAAQCGRRSGKTNGLALRFFQTLAKYPRSQCMYLALTQDSAREIMWPVLQELNDKFKIGCEFTESKLTMTHPNGAKLKLMGADLSGFIKRLRGRKYPGVAIDECQDFGIHLQSLIEDILTPSIADYEDGWVALTGTPGPVPSGTFFDITQKNMYGYSLHKWVMNDNPYMPNSEGFIQELIKTREWTPENPTLLREYRNQWVLDVQSLWIQYKADKNHYAQLPVITPDKWNYLVGVDIGYRDADAIAVLAWSDACKETYLVEESIITKQDITALADGIEAVIKKYNPDKIVMDEGGLGKKAAEEMRRRRGLPIHPADKMRKQEHVAFLNDALRTGRFKAKSGSRFAQDSYLIQIDWEASTPDKIVIKKQPHSDIIDSVLYAFVESPAFAYQKKIEAPVYGSKEWAEAQSDKMFEAAQEHFGRQADMERKSNGWD